jgi:hypothetical protein
MQQQPTLSPAEQDRLIDSAVLGLMMHADARLWSKDEIDREIGRPSDVTDSLNRLYAGGLIHRLDAFAWPTRAAILAEDMRL